MTPQRAGMARNLLTALGAIKVFVTALTDCPSNYDLDKYDLFISDDADLAKRQLQNRKVDTWEWLKQCVIAGRVLPSLESRVFSQD